MQNINSHVTLKQADFLSQHPHKFCKFPIFSAEFCPISDLTLGGRTGKVS